MRLKTLMRLFTACLMVLGPARSDKLVESDREIAHTFARRVENRVCYGGGDTDDSNLADSARAEIGRASCRERVFSSV